MVAERMRCAITASMIGVVLEIELGRCKVYIRVRWGQVEGKCAFREVDTI